MFATRDGQVITVAKDLVACFRQKGNWVVELHCDRRWKFVVAADSMDAAHAMALAVYSKEFGKQSLTGADCQRIAAWAAHIREKRYETEGEIVRQRLERNARAGPALV